MRARETASSGVVRPSGLLTSRFFSILLLAFVAASSVMFTAGCKRKGEAAAESVAAPVVSDATEGLLLTWIDEKGEFHTEQRVTDVPASGREIVSVRVLDPAMVLPWGYRVFVANLVTRGPDAT
jgi:hypothetical protein